MVPVTVNRAQAVILTRDFVLSYYKSENGAYFRLVRAWPVENTNKRRPKRMIRKHNAVSSLSFVVALFVVLRDRVFPIIANSPGEFWGFSRVLCELA